VPAARAKAGEHHTLNYYIINYYIF
jgi:hypothetical protein